MKVLSIQKDVKTINVSPDRKNIKYVVRKIENAIDSAWVWLVDKLKAFKESFPRTIIYCNSIKDVASIYNYLSLEVVECVELFDMFHSETTDDIKSNIIHRLSTKSSLRIVIATSAMGMGVDVADCHNIILYGPPRSVVDLLQETGRAGRDGGPSVALIMCNSYQVRHVDSEVRDIVSTCDCRRKEILGNFLTQEELLTHISTDSPVHTCCDSCFKACQCGNCELSDMESFLAMEMQVDFESDTNTSSESDATLSAHEQSDQSNSESEASESLDVEELLL